MTRFYDANDTPLSSPLHQEQQAEKSFAQQSFSWEPVPHPDLFVGSPPSAPARSVLHTLSGIFSESQRAGVQTHTLPEPEQFIFGEGQEKVSPINEPVLFEQITLQNFLNKPWKKELVSFELKSFPSSLCRKENLSLQTPNGNPLPFQLSDSSFVRAGVFYQKTTIWFVVDSLKPYETKKYILQCGNRKKTMPPTDLQVKRSQNKEFITFSTKKISITFRQFDVDLPGAGKVAASAKDVLPPIASIVSNGVAFGGSQMYGPDKIKKYRSYVDAEGPIFAQINFVYTYDSGVELFLSARLAAGDSKVFWHSRVNSPSSQTSGWRFLFTSPQRKPGQGKTLFTNLSSFELVYTTEFVNNIGYTPTGPKKSCASVQNKLCDEKDKKKECDKICASFVSRCKGLGDNKFDTVAVDLWNLTLVKPKEGDPILTYLTPWNDWWDGKTQTRWVFRTGPKDFFEVSSTDPDTWVPDIPFKSKLTREVVDEERNTRHVWWQHNMLPLKQSERGKIKERIYIEFKSYATRDKEGVPTGKVGERSWSFGSPEGGLNHTLNQVKDYILHWPQSPRTPPYTSPPEDPWEKLYGPTWEGALPVPRLGSPATAPYTGDVLFFSVKELINISRSVSNKDAYLWIQTAKANAKPIAQMSLGAVRSGAIHACKALLARPSLATLTATRAVQYLEHLLKAHVDFCMNYHTLSACQIDQENPLYTPQYLFALYAILDKLNLPVFTPQQKVQIRPQMAYIAYTLNETATVYWFEKGYNASNPDLYFIPYFNRVMFGFVLPEHPRSSHWRSNARFLLNLYLGLIEKDGEVSENSHYAITTLEALVAIFLLFPDVMQKDKFTHSLQYLMATYTPKDPRFLNERAPNSYARGYLGERSSWPGIFAKYYYTLSQNHKGPYQTKFEDLGKELQYIWNESGNPLGSDAPIMAVFGEFLVAKPNSQTSIPTQYPAWAERSHQNKNYTLFTHGYGQADEHQMFFLNSKDDFYTMGGVKGLFAFGRPVSSVFFSGVGNSAAPGANMREAPLQSRVLARRKWLVRCNHDQHAVKDFLTYDKLQNPSTTFHGLPFQDTLRFEATILIKPISSQIGSLLTFPETSQHPSKDSKDCTEKSKAEKDATPKSKFKPVPRWPSSRPYVDTKKNSIQLTRQIVFIKDEAPDGIHYYVFRDSVTGNQPTEWAMWTSTQGIFPIVTPGATLQPYTPEQIVPTKELKGDRFIAVGGEFWPEYCASTQTPPKCIPNPDLNNCVKKQPSHYVDIEYYVASPRDTKQTPRHTMRWGGNLGCYADVKDVNSVTFEDILHLQLAGNGSYFVALFPKKRSVLTAPSSSSSLSFTTLKKKVIQIKGKDSQGNLSFTDHVYMSETNDKIDLTQANIQFSGTVASVLDRKSYLALSLSAKGKIITKDYEFVSGWAASIKIKGDQLLLNVADSSEHSGIFSITIKLNGNSFRKPPKTDPRHVNGHALNPSGDELRFIVKSSSAFSVEASLTKSMISSWLPGAISEYAFEEQPYFEKTGALETFSQEQELVQGGSDLSLLPRDKRERSELNKCSYCAETPGAFGGDCLACQIVGSTPSILPHHQQASCCDSCAEETPEILDSFQ